MGKKAKDVGEEMTKEEKARQKVMDKVAKHLRFNIPTKKAVIKGQKIEYFQGDKAVDCLMASQWTKEPKGKDDYVTPHFVTRVNAIDYCIKLLQKEYFVRANKVEVRPKSEEPSSSSSKEVESSSLRRRGEKATDSPRAKKGDASDSDASKKRKKKYRLEVHPHQIFADSADDVYFWRYDPPSHGTYLIGAGVVIGAVALTMQPLWPDSTRAGLWYLSMSVFILMGVMVTLIVGRWFVYGLGLVFSLGKMKFWIFPNLDNEKLGFVESFKPFYSLEYAKDTKGKKKKKGKGKEAEKSEQSVKDKDQAGEEEGGEESEDSGEKGAASDDGGVREQETQLTEQATS